MSRGTRRFMLCALALVGVSGVIVRSQGRGGQVQPSPFIASPTHVVAIRTGRLFDSKAGTMLSNQTVLITGDRIADIGPGVRRTTL